jgi:hypothetical protein
LVQKPCLLTRCVCPESLSSLFLFLILSFSAISAASAVNLKKSCLQIQ